MVQEKLEQAIKLVAPTAQFELQLVSGHLSGSVIAEEFEEMTHLKRQQMVWDQIRKDLGPESKQVGILLLYTPEEATIVDED